MKASASVLFAALFAYLGELAAPLLVLAAAMALDYATGLAKAYIKKELSSKTGFRGILKKLCSMAMVAVGAEVDYLLSGALAAAGAGVERTMFCGLLVAVWLTVNELISVLENLAAVGVPGFAPLEKLLRRLRDSAERSGDE